MADFKIQRGQSSMAATVTSVTITAGTDYDAPSAITKAFIRIVANGAHSDGGSSAFAGQPDYNSANITNPGNLLTSITFARLTGTGAVNLQWEIWEYTGSAGGANEFKVLGQERLTVNTSSSTADSSAFTPTDDNDVVAFITAQSSNDAGTARGDIDSMVFTSEWVAASDLIRVTRSETGDDSYCNVAAVEFTGSNWTIQRITHSISAADTDETASMTAISAITEAFLHVQHRAPNANSPNDGGFKAWISSTTQLTFRVDNLSTSHDLVAWVIENSEMTVQHLSGSWAASASDPDTNDVSVTTVSALAETTVQGECATFGGSTSDTHETMMGVRMTSTSNVRLFRGISNQARDYRFSVVQLPTDAAAGVVNERTLSDNVSVTDTDALVYRELFEAFSENLSIVDSIITFIEINKTFSENLEVTDNILKFCSIFKAMSDNVVLSDSLNKNLEFFRRVSDTLDITDSLIASLGKVISRSLQDNLNITDSTLITVFRNKLVELLDNVTVTDDLLKSVELLRLLSDNLNVTDSLIVSLVQALKVRILSDNVEVTDSIVIALQTALIAASFIKSDIEIKEIISRLESKSISHSLE